MKTKPYMMPLMMLAGWINRQQHEAINYLKEENKILKHELLKAAGKKRIILNDKQRRRLAILAKRVGRKMLLSQKCERLLTLPTTELQPIDMISDNRYDIYHLITSAITDICRKTKILKSL